MKHNTGEAILILGAIYLFTIIEGWTKWLLLVLIGLGLITWSTIVKPKNEQILMDLQIEKMRLEIDLMKAQVKMYVARGAEIVSRLKKQ